MDQRLKESIRGDLRLANAFINAGRPDLGRQLLVIALARQRVGR